MKHKSAVRAEEMYMAVELWQQGGLSQREFCKRNDIALPTFGYWLGKYKQEKEEIPVTAEGAVQPNNSTNGFVSLEIAATIGVPEGLKVHYPNGVQIHCPVGLGAAQLKTLITLI